MYKVGDLVNIRPNLLDGEVRDNMNVASGMLGYRGQQAHITHAFQDCYSLDVDAGYYFWTDGMFASYKDEALDRLLSLGKTRRDSLAQQIIFDCAMELLYRAEKIPDDVLANKLMNALTALDKVE